MTDKPATVTFRYCLVCDDARREEGGKEMLIGVYSSGLAVPFYPFAAEVTLWIAVMWQGEGTLQFQVRVLGPSKNQLAQKDGVGRAIQQGRDSALIFRKLIFAVDVAGDYEIQWKVANNDWRTIKMFPVAKET